MAEINVREGARIITKDGDEFRVISLFSGMACLCKINTEKFELIHMSVQIILDRLRSGEYTSVEDKPIVFDVTQLSPEAAEKFHFRKTFVDAVVYEYGPTYSELDTNVPKPILRKYLAMRDENGKPYFSKRIMWRILRKYFQSGMQDSTLLDQRSVAKRQSRKNFKTVPGRKPTVGEPTKNLTDEDRKNFKNYMRKYMKSEVSTQKEAFLDMIDKCYSIRMKTLDENGNVMYMLTPLPAEQRPNYQQFNRYIRINTTKKARDEAKETTRVVRNKKHVFTSTVMDGINGPCHMCEVDAQEMDIALVSEEYPDIPVGRPIIYVIIDVMSEIILGVSLAMDNNSIVGLTNVFLNLVEDKEKLYQKYCNTEFHFSEGMTMDDVWPTGYRPLIMKYDNGSDFLSYEIQRILKELSITPRYLTAATGSLKPLVENFFHSIKTDLDDLLEHKGLIRKVYGSKHHEEACLTYSDAMAIMLNHVLEHNMHVVTTYRKSADMIKKGVKATPANLWKYGCETMRQPAKFDSRDQVIYSIMHPETKVSMSSQGIFFNGLVYFNPDDAKLQEEAYATGRKRVKFNARSDPRDVGHLYYLRDGRLMQASVPTEDFRLKTYIGMSRKQYDELVKKALELSKQEQELNENIRIDLRRKNKDIIDAATKANPGKKNPDHMREARREEKERISGTRSVAERFDIADNGMEQGDKAALDTEKSTQEAVEKALPSPMDKVPIKDEKPQNKASEHHDGITFFKSDPNDTLEDIHRKMAESYDPWEDDSY